MKICLSELNPVLLNQSAFSVHATNVMIFTFNEKGTTKSFIKMLYRAEMLCQYFVTLIF